MSTATDRLSMAVSTFQEHEALAFKQLNDWLLYVSEAGPQQRVRTLH